MDAMEVKLREHEDMFQKEWRKVVKRMTKGRGKSSSATRRCKLDAGPKREKNDDSETEARGTKGEGDRRRMCIAKGEKHDNVTYKGRKME